jgi:hypothetical protein
MHRVTVCQGNADRPRSAVPAREKPGDLGPRPQFDRAFRGHGSPERPFDDWASYPQVDEILVAGLGRSAQRAPQILRVRARLEQSTQHIRCDCLEDAPSPRQERVRLKEVRDPFARNVEGAIRGRFRLDRVTLEDNGAVSGTRDRQSTG